MPSVLSWLPVARNTVALLASRALAVAGQVLATALLTRLLGASSFGEYAVALSYALAIGLAVDGGAQLVAIRYGARHGTAAATLIGASLAGRLALGGCGWMVAVIAALAWSPGPTVPLAVMVSGGLLVAGSWVSALTAPLYARTAAHRAAVLEALPWLFQPGLLLAFWAGGLFPWSGPGGVVAAVGLLALAYLLAGVAGVALVGWRAGERVARTWDPSLSRHLLVAALPVMAMTLLSQVHLRGAAVVLGALQPGIPAAEYALALRLFEGVMLVPPAVMASFYPLLSAAPGGVAPGAIVWRATALCMAAAGLLAGAGWFVAPQIALALGGAELLSAAPALRLLLIASVAGAANSPLAYLLLARGHERAILRVQVGVVAANLGLNLALIPHFGSVGAAAVLVATELAGLGIAVVLAQRLVGLAWPWSGRSHGWRRPGGRL
ncbi:MAG: polysaccharide biosynthesis C-terminal domain-containing protein [Chloroflexi bacterium]|nr:polysaccharide biosynthesis C-terminal domain-containing protein [Chloroflexota bacterium]